MHRAATALLAAVSLSACALSPPRDLYAGYGIDFGTYVANSGVSTFCFLPQLRLAIWSVEAHFGRHVVVTSGYRDPINNWIVGGKEDSYHQKCMAADFFIPGVPKSEIIDFVYRDDLVGGMGCYPGQGFIHMDVRQRPPGWTHPVTFSGC